jgi:putative tricarboxylic transport membrane protein
MSRHTPSRSRVAMFRRLAVLTVAAAAIAAQPAGAQEGGWKPTKPVVLVAPNAPGGTSDRTARVIQRIMQSHGLVDVPVSVLNKPGGNGTIALTHLSAQGGDAHYLLIATSSAISNHITGMTPLSYTEFTSVALLFDEYFSVNVHPGGSLASARDMLDRLRKSPDILSFGVSSMAGNNYTSLASALKKGGVDVRRLRTVSFGSGGKTTMALLGGHVDAVSTGVSNMVSHLRDGKMRSLVVSGPTRIWGPFADIPTWKEVGVDAVHTSWRGILAPKGMTAEQLAYWDGVFQRLVKTADWEKDLQENFWANTYLGPSEARRRLDGEHAELKQILTDLGMAKVR